MKPTPLTDEDIGRIDVYSGTQMEFARAIEAAVNAKWEAENKRLREALEKIATFDHKLRPTPEDLRDVARAALKGDV